MQTLRSRGRYRGVKGGLDHAVRQAEDRNLFDQYVFDADTHANELFADLGKYVSDSRWKKIFATDPTDSQMEPLAKVAHQHFAAASFAGGGHYKRPYGSGEPTTKKNHHPTVYRDEVSFPGPMSIEETAFTFAQRMQEIGIKQCLVFPGSSLAEVADVTKDSEFEFQMIKAYTLYMLDNFLGKHKEIVSAIHAPLNAKYNATKVAELIDDYGGERGIVGVLFFGMNPTPMGSDDFNPIYEAAERKGLPILLHADNGNHMQGPFFEYYRDKYAFNTSLGFISGLASHLTSLIVDGVPERYPKLKFVFIEGGVTWVAPLMHRLDDTIVKKKYEVPLLKKLPSEYMSDFYYCTQPLESIHKNELEPFFKCMKNWEDHWIYASDYPHWDFDVPSTVYDLPFLSKDAKTKIMGGNARKLFRLD